MRPHRWQPTRLPRPWDSPGNNTGLGCHFLLQCMKKKSESEVTQSCPTLCDPMDCSSPGSSFHEIVQARVLEWVAIAFSAVRASEHLFSSLRCVYLFLTFLHRIKLFDIAFADCIEVASLRYLLKTNENYYLRYKKCYLTSRITQFYFTDIQRTQTIIEVNQSETSKDMVTKRSLMESYVNTIYQNFITKRMSKV